MPFQKGYRPPNAGKGRVKGVPNKVTKNAKANIAAVFESIGGLDAMAAWAREKPDLFYAIYARLLPHEVTGEDGGPVQTTVIHEYVGLTPVTPVMSVTAADDQDLLKIATDDQDLLKIGG